MPLRRLRLFDQLAHYKRNADMQRVMELMVGFVVKSMPSVKPHLLRMNGALHDAPKYVVRDFHASRSFARMMARSNPSMTSLKVRSGWLFQ